MEDKYGYNKYRLDKATLPNKPITLDNIEELGFYIEHMEGYTYFHPIADYIFGPTHMDLSNWCNMHNVFTFHDFADYIDRLIEYLTKLRDERGF